MTMHLLSEAVFDVTIWRDDYEQSVTELTAAGPALRPMAESVLAHPETGWWFGPMLRDRQLWHVSGIQTEFSAAREPFVPNRGPTSWELYAQKPAWGLQTSTDTTRSGFSSLLVGNSLCAYDLGPIDYPLERLRLTVSPSARVYTVDGPEAWRRLCLTYPVRYGNGAIAPSQESFERLHADFLHKPWYTRGHIIPDFASVSSDFDAVHITLSGLLTGSHVRLEGPEGWTWLWGFDAEVTFWLRWVFENAERLPDLTEPILTPPQLR
ncbi:MAG TPA: hypothetical protein VFI12_09120 [Thermomicrobiales bacterium]|jgi:hypothetical protein|nr:hypothetical protein [Thermomicrobiales bacterium]